MDEWLGHLLQLRARLRSSREARSIVDQAIGLAVRAQQADEREMEQLDREVEALAAELDARFGPRPKVTVN